MSECPHDVVITGEYPRFIERVPVDRVLLSEPPVIGVGIGDGLRSKQVLIDDEHTISRRAGAITGRLWQQPQGSGSAPRRAAICTSWRGRCTGSAASLLLWQFFAAYNNPLVRKITRR